MTDNREDVLKPVFDFREHKLHTNAKKLGVEVHELCAECLGDCEKPWKYTGRGVENATCYECMGTGVRAPKTYDY
jgi:DnaJ-class molecular chaperone